MTQRLLGFALLSTVLLSGGCSFGLTQARFEPLGARHPARPPDAAVEVFRAGRPDRPHVDVARLDVHLERSMKMSTFDNALPELKKQARLAGADAIVDIEETNRWWGEKGIYHVTAIGVRFQ